MGPTYDRAKTPDVMRRTLQSISDEANEVGFSKQRAEGETEPVVRARGH
jgi:hypothetical protein